PNRLQLFNVALDFKPLLKKRGIFLTHVIHSGLQLRFGIFALAPEGLASLRPRPAERRCTDALPKPEEKAISFKRVDGRERLLRKRPKHTLDLRDALITAFEREPALPKRGIDALDVRQRSFEFRTGKRVTLRHRTPHQNKSAPVFTEAPKL